MTKPSPDAKREFTSKKIRWLEKVARDCRSLPPLASPICIWFCHLFNLEYGGGAWPWQDEIARAFGVERETVNKVLAALIRRGHLKATRRGRDRSNLYHMIVDDGDEAAEAAQSRCDRTGTSSGGLDVIAGAHHVAHDVIDRRFRCDRSQGHDVIAGAHKERRSFKTSSKKDRGRSESERRAARSHTHPAPDDAARGRKRTPDGKKEKARAENNTDAGFAEFWAAFPRKEGIDAARKAYAAAVAAGAKPVEINQGAKLYALKEQARIAREGKPHFTMKPANWIKAGGWKDVLPDGAVVEIDEAGNVVGVAQPQPEIIDPVIAMAMAAVPSWEEEDRILAEKRREFLARASGRLQ